MVKYGLEYVKHTVKVEDGEGGDGIVRFKKGVDFGDRKWESMGWYGALEVRKYENMNMFDFRHREREREREREDPHFKTTQVLRYSLIHS